MSRTSTFVSRTSLLLSLLAGSVGMAVPIASPAIASPELLAQSSYLAIRSGTTLPVDFEQEKILVTPDETVPVTLTIAANVRNRQGILLIPYGSELIGRVEPYGNGARFVAESIAINGYRQPIEATSNVVTRTEVVRRGASTGEILQNAAIGGAAAAVLAEVTGGIDVEEVLGGAGAGALGTLLLGGREVELISIDPDRDLDIVLQSPLALRL